MYGLITRLTAHSGRRDELGLCLLDPNLKRPGCHSYVLAHDLNDADALWVTEVWMSKATHDAWSAQIRETHELLPALSLIATFGDTVFTRPIGGVGL
ncbi:MAG: antibiotic biosynthesis monooxygenase [Caulobacteraceae bacterium]|uniref:antibiotic biosynthesis monooxygenase family protein n=1 Tax=Brevundimonas sp. G8 TaxID=1350776 RepID=UPI0010E653B1|nr:antibiotic biosynthesis monooxygenase family protein [Brevundimonas sp. G8]RYG17429.1 MAG: antibiotic biosynthesis monooxygenase [Caulobacteraceae bacterium]VXB37245.1 Antibiotic biosynthesis monooxygenase [Brevundimonas sp. G8]